MGNEFLVVPIDSATAAPNLYYYEVVCNANTPRSSIPCTKNYGANKCLVYKITTAPFWQVDVASLAKGREPCLENAAE